MSFKLRRADGAQEFTLSLAYEQYEAVGGVIEIEAEEIVMWAVGTGLYELVKDAPAPKQKAAPVKKVQEDS